MDDKTILQQAIEKAVNNGYSQWTDDYLKEVIKGYWPWQAVIFSHQFAKAFYGEEHKVNSFVPDYLYHLQRQVIYEVDGKEAPLKYIEQFLTNQQPDKESAK